VSNADQDVFVPALKVLEPLKVVAGSGIRKTYHPNFHAVLLEDGLMLVVEPFENPRRVKNPEGLLGEESIVPVNAVMVARRTINRAGIVRVMLSRAAHKLVRVAAWGFDMEEVSPVKDS
jgi:hypothetical protein